MHWTEIFTIVFIVVLVGLLVFKFVRDKKKGVTGCNCGSGKGKALVKAYHKQKEKDCCCKDK